VRLFVFAAALAVLLQSFGQMIILINFKINQEYIARVLCENKDKPEMKCNGKCHLNKQLKADEQKQTQLPPQVKLKEVLQIAVETLRLNPVKPGGVGAPAAFLYDGNVLKGFHLLVFQPPEHS